MQTGYPNIINVYTDGGARGNPGPSAVGVYITDKDDQKIIGFGEKIGFATNNVAEYKAVIAALAWLSDNIKTLNEISKIFFFLDSNLVYSQISGLFKIKDGKLRELLFEIRQKEALISIPIQYSHIPREKNKEADKFVNLALDNKL